MAVRAGIATQQYIQNMVSAQHAYLQTSIERKLKQDISTVITNTKVKPLSLAVDTVGVEATWWSTHARGTNQIHVRDTISNT